jgi:E3 ubiquitin-protein ligase UBR1
LLAQDQFIFLAEAAVCLVPSMHLDIHHVMRLCYLAEILRVIVAYRESFISELDINSIPEIDYPRSFFEFLNHLPKPVAGGVELPWASNAASLDEVQLRAGVLFKLIESYALPFLRKCVILMHVRYGVDFPVLGFSPDEPEIIRLSHALNLPSLGELFTESLSNPTNAMLAGWLQHWRHSHDFPRHASTISLSHPAIFELVGLPKNFDTLQDEVMKRRCPTTGKDLTDPCVCLFCGEIFCGQAVCCTSEDSKGGCYQHRVKYATEPKVQEFSSCLPSLQVRRQHRPLHQRTQVHGFVPQWCKRRLVSRAVFG